MIQKQHQEAPLPKSVIESIRTYADGFGRWRSEIIFEHTLNENDPRAEFNLGHHWAKLHRRARADIVQAISEREKKVGETRAQAKKRVNDILGQLHVIKQGISSINTWFSVTLGEVYH